MPTQKEENSILFIDIETVPEVYELNELSERRKELFEKKFQNAAEKKEQSMEDFYKNAAGIFAEFSKVICISCGYIDLEGKWHCTSFYGKEEKKILEEFTDVLNRFFTLPQQKLCAHNGKEFDFPFLCRRMVVNGVKLPSLLDLQGKKPWEVPHLDTLEYWKFGDWKNFTSLDLLCEVLHIPTPKSDIEGKDVARVYYEENDLERIKEYCERDTKAVANVYQRLHAQPLLDS